MPTETMGTNIHASQRSIKEENICWKHMRYGRKSAKRDDREWT